MKLLSINTVGCVSNAPARIMLNISEAVKAEVGSAIVCYGRGNCNSNITSIRIGSDIDFVSHTAKSRLLDSEGLHSQRATKRLIDSIKSFNPDIIHLHNLHGHYLNYPILFNFLHLYNRPVVWTLHDCWAFTGHCTHYTVAKCDKWKIQCHSCPQKNMYPSSWIADCSKRNYSLKKELFTSIPNLHIVTVSEWLKKQVSQSFFKDYPIYVIPNGIDTDIFTPNPNRSCNNKTILFAASIWNKRKGLDDILALSQIIPNDYEIKIVGTIPRNFIKSIPSDIKVTPRISDTKILSEIYANAGIFINPSVEETFGMTTIEALSCGTPVIVNNSTALPEIAAQYPNSIAKIVNTSEPTTLFEAITEILHNPDYIKLRSICRKNTIKNYSVKQMTNKYIELYSSLTQF